MKAGQMIKLRAYGNEVITRQLIRVGKKTVVVCKAEEYEAALREKREPVTVGFNISDVVSPTHRMVDLAS